MGAIRGLDCKVYYNSATYESPTWVEWACVRDTAINLSYEEADASCRGSNWRQTVITLGSLEVTGNALVDKDDASYVAFAAAAVARTVLDLLVMDGVRSSADSDGWRGDFQITGWNQAQNYEDVLVQDFTLKPTRSDNALSVVSGPQPPA